MTFYYDHAHALGHLDAAGPDHHRARHVPDRARAAPATGARTACARGCRTPTATAPTPGRTRPDPGRQLRVQGRPRPAWDENYGAGGARTAPTSRSRARRRQVVTISLRPRHPPISVTTSRAGCRAGPEQGQGASGSTRDLVAWPATSVPRHRPAAAQWRLHWSPTGGLAVDAEAVTGGSTRRLSYDAAGLPARVVAAHPELKGYLALRLDRGPTAGRPARSCAGRSRWRMYDTAGPAPRRHRRADPRSCSTTCTPPAATGDARRHLARAAPTLPLWAPTAQKVDC